MIMTTAENSSSQTQLPFGAPPPAPYAPIRENPLSLMSNQAGLYFSQTDISAIRDGQIKR
ncbi:MAG: hypothetical protein COA68_00225 [Oceanobacter sp.]|nr:MAG: hypothetical protein COA68_00225 [Oceanobacter sp.]